VVSAIDRMKAIGVGIPDILLPKKEIDLKKWAIVACDQYTSEEQYWQRVDSYVGESPSTLRLILPEVYLEKPNLDERIDDIRKSMNIYREKELFDVYKNSFFLIHRETNGGPGRWGLIVALDLEKYDYSKDSKSPIRATEGTILSRIPPRKLIRQDVPYELPHILVLIDDEYHLLIGPLLTIRSTLKKVYETELMEGGGRIKAYQINQDEIFEQIATAFEKLNSKCDSDNPILFAMGDGNHSLATAKSCWEDIKVTLNEEERKNHPARYALAEIMNIFDPGLVFEPIHRLLFDTDKELFLTQLATNCEEYHIERYSNIESLLKAVEERDEYQRVGYVDTEGLKLIKIEKGKASCTAGTVQLTLDELIEKDVRVDYIHGADVTLSLGSKSGNIGLFLPAIDKHDFFETIKLDGALPRKTFSMGEAHEKRFYIEVRKIV